MTDRKTAKADLEVVLLESKSISIDLLRHGETTAVGSFIGSSDPILNKTGWQQMQDAVPENLNYDVVISSPMKRCRDYAEEFSKKFNIPLVIEKDLREMCFGEWEDKTSEWVWENDQQALLAFWQDPISNPATGGEAIEVFHARVIRVFTRILKEYSNQQLLLVGHGGSIKSILTWLLDSSLRNANKLNISHGGLSRIRIAYGKNEFYPVVEYINR